MSMIRKELYQFGPFSLDPAERLVSRDGTPLSLTPKVFDTLVCLVRSQGRLLTKDELLKEIWRDTFVEEVNLAVNISTLRKMLGEGPQEGRYIVTVPGRGYRFVAAVQKVTKEASDERDPSSGNGLVASPEVDLGTTEHRSEELGLEKSNGADYSVASIAPAIRRDLPPRQENIVLGHSPMAPSASGGMRWWIAAIVVVLAIAVLAGRGYFHLHRTPKITEKDTLVLADFANSTGDPVFDDTLRQGLSVQLEQSPFLAIISDNKINQTLKMMGHPAGDRLTPEVTREVCQRMGSKAMLTGSIAGLGKQYVIGLKGVNCESGDLLAEAQEQAASKEGVLKALDAAAVHLRTKLGESLGTVQEYATPLENATTPSLEALKAYSQGRKTRSAKGDDAALPFYKRAIELDPNFAYAYLSLAVSYFNLNETGLAAQYSRKAYELREKVSERERFGIEATYYNFATGELEKAANTFELWQQTYPRNSSPYTDLGAIYSNLGYYEKALNEQRDAILREPNNVLSYSNLGLAYMYLNRLSEAEAVYKQAEERKLEGEGLLGNRYLLAFLQGDAAQMERFASAAVGKVGTEDQMLQAQADTQAWYGKLKSARELTRRAMDSAEHNDAQETAAAYLAESALREAALGNREKARADSNAAVKLAPNRDVQAMTALALVRAGDEAGAQKLAANLDRTFPLDALVQRYWLPTIRAAAAIERKDPNRAVELLKETGAMELGVPNGFAILVPVYVRGEAYLALDDGSRAAAEFQKFIDHRGLVANFPWGALSRLGIARANALEAKTAQGADADAVRARALAAYKEFLGLWKDADPDIPILKQAKAEYAKLQR